jgi:hypothetical protein
MSTRTTTTGDRCPPDVPHQALSAVDITRAILGIAVGYVIFAGASVLFFVLSGRDPHAPHETSFLLLAAAVGALYSALAGYVCVAVAGRAARPSMIALAVTIALGAAVLLFVRRGQGPVWWELAAIGVLAPAAFIGGLARCRQASVWPRLDHDRP